MLLSFITSAVLQETVRTSAVYDMAFQPVSPSEIEEHGNRRNTPGYCVAGTEYRQRMEFRKDGKYPDNPEQADSQADDNNRAYRVSGAAKHC